MPVTNVLDLYFGCFARGVYMTGTRLMVHPDWVIDEVSPLIFGGFLEHMGRAVYEGVYDPDSEHADEDGCRQPVTVGLGPCRSPRGPRDCRCQTAGQ